MRARYIVVLALLFLFPSLHTLAHAQRPLHVELVATEVDEPLRARYLRALDRVLDYYSREFGPLPVPSVHLYLYPDAEAFERGLVQVGRMSPDLARVVARANTALAIWDPWGMLINTSRPRRIEGLLAHEFMHIMQAAWGGRRSDTRGPQWLREGMASFYQAKVEEALGLRPPGTWDHSTRKAVAEHVDALLGVPLTINFETWARLNATLGTASNGWSVLYSWAYLAYSRLAAQVSRDDIIRFFTVPNTGMHFAEAFERTFGISVARFETELKEYIQSLKP